MLAMRIRTVCVQRSARRLCSVTRSRVPKTLQAGLEIVRKFASPKHGAARLLNTPELLTAADRMEAVTGISASLLEELNDSLAIIHSSCIPLLRCDTVELLQLFLRPWADNPEMGARGIQRELANTVMSWADIKRGRDLFVPGLSSFNIPNAVNAVFEFQDQVQSLLDPKLWIQRRKGARTSVGSPAVSEFSVPAVAGPAGRAPTRASRPADGVHHFRQGVFSPPVVLAGASLSPTATASDAVWGENSTRQRMVLALVAETLLEVHLRFEHDMCRNGGVPAVLFLSKLMCCSAMLRDAAGANSLWAPLISACFGADAYAASALRVSDSAVKERMQHHIFGAIARGLHAAPSMWCYSLFIERGSHARTSAIVFDEGGLPSMRPLTRDERQRVVFWRPRFKLLDDMGDAFSISPRAAARVADDAPKLKCPAALLRVPPSGSMPTATRMLEVIAPEGAPCVTLELLVTALSAFESGWRAREGRVDLLQDLLLQLLLQIRRTLLPMFLRVRANRVQT